jgi:hypothetical protein
MKLLIFSLLLLISNTLLAEVTAKINRTVLSIDETLMMKIVQTNGSSGEPDLSVLKKNFQILSQSQSQNFSFINGRSSSSHTWDLTLLAKDTGEVMIPAIPVGNESTQPIQLFVKKPSATPAIDGKEIFVEISIAPDKQAYVQQQVLLTVSLFSRIRFTNASLTEPEIENAVVERIGDESSFRKLIGQHDYTVIERRYAVYPQQSGTMEIPDILFTGNVKLQQSGFSLFSRSGRRIISRTQAISLDVLPIPDSYTGKNWLPAKHISIESNILEDETAIKAGEALTRRIVVSAVGLIGSQLPAISVPSSSGYKSYPDKETISSQLIENKIVGTRQDSMAIIPIHSGQITLPEVKIDWWNTNTQQQETTILAAKTLSVAKNDSMPELTQSKPTRQKKIKQSVENKQEQDSKPVQQIASHTARKPASVMHNIWFWISISLIFLWLTTLGLLLSRRKNTRQEPVIQLKTTTDIQQIHKQLKQSCSENDPLKTTRLMVSWARLYLHDSSISGLAQVLELIDDQELIQEINHLEQSRYAAVQQNWSGKSFCQALDRFIQQHTMDKERQDNQQTLAPLNRI